MGYALYGKRFPFITDSISWRLFSSIGMASLAPGIPKYPNRASSFPRLNVKYLKYRNSCYNTSKNAYIILSNLNNIQMCNYDEHR